MNVNTQAVHPSLQRYLPGHLPKRQRRLCTGKTNSNKFQFAHLADVETEVAQRLTLPSRLAQSLLSSPTVTRAVVVDKTIDQIGIGDFFGIHPKNDSNSISRASVNDNKNSKTVQSRETATSLLALKATGKEQRFNEETFYFGCPTMGGAGQLEYNDPSDRHGRNYIVSAWNTRHHFSRDIWFSRATQHPAVTDPMIQGSNPLTTNMNSEGIHKNTNGYETPIQELKEKKQLTSVEAQPYVQTGCTPLSNSHTWPDTYNPPNVYNVPPPKLRYQLTDYHPTFHHTKGEPNSFMYISEKERFQSTKAIPLPTPTNITLYTYGRRRYPNKEKEQ
ncbi:hypothetical protein MOQ_000101 [Trypanosoma cruzi marinkellei]|uniref:Uncharacterized protein n=1 Tax=Trypanosoma cruzi marinkellei TaxID=85056 RepID=K2PFD8_TRYCR|nr:hypothetical protein MOQ_000101 [Trypanosoma cruzi marinkellei]